MAAKRNPTLYTAIENSPPTWAKYPHVMQGASARQEVLVGGAINQPIERTPKIPPPGLYANAPRDFPHKDREGDS